MSANSHISAVLAAIPDEEDASFVAQVGERARVTSRAGSVDLDPDALTAAAIDSLNASIFPPDRLRTLQQTGRVDFYFALPDVDGWFSAVAGAYRDDRWLEIRRRKTAGPPRVQPAAVPQATQPSPATETTSGFDDDLLDLSGLEFPPKDVDPDPDVLSVSEDLFGMPLAERPPSDARVESEDRRRAVVYPQRDRQPRRIGIPVAASAAIAVLGMLYFGFAASPAATSAAVIVPPRPAPPAPRQVPLPTPLPPPTPPPPATASSPVQADASSVSAETAPRAEERRNGFSVQIAAVQTRDEADRMVTRFVTRGYSAYIARGDGAAANYFRVRIGAFPDRKTAVDVARQLEGVEGIKPWIAKEE